MDIEALLDRYGLAVVLVGCFLEGDAVALTAGVLEHRGLLAFWPTILAAAAGGWLWDLTIFGLGRAFRAHPRIARALAHPKAQRITARLLGRPVLLAAIFRFVPGSRTVAPLALATASRISVPAYATTTAAAALVWAFVLVAVGHDIGSLIERVLGRVNDPRWFLAIPALSLVALAAWSALRRRCLKRG